MIKQQIFDHISNSAKRRRLLLSVFMLTSLLCAALVSPVHVCAAGTTAGTAAGKAAGTTAGTAAGTTAGTAAGIIAVLDDTADSGADDTKDEESKDQTNIRDTVNSRTDTIRSKKPGVVQSASGAGSSSAGASSKVTSSKGTSSKESSSDGSESSESENSKESENVQVYPEKYDMNLTLDTKGKTLSGTVTVRIKNNTGKKLTMICIRNYASSVLSQNGGKASDAEIISVETLKGDSLQTTVGKDQSVIYVSLGDNGIEKSGEGTFIIDFNEKIPKLDDRFGYHENSDGGLMFQLSYCFPVLAMYEDGKWDENPYFYAGETAYSPCTDYTAVLKVPKDYTTVSSGTSSKNGGSVKINAEDVRDLAVISCNYMRSESADSGDKKINLYYLTDNKKSADFRKYVMGAARDAMPIFSDRFGDYVYDELDVVESYLPGGMEYPGLVMIETNSDSNNTSYSDLCTLTAHEIGHQWFYAAVGNNQYDEAWLDEGLATYLEKGIYASSKSSTLTAAVKYDKKNKITPVKTWDSEAAYGKYMDSIVKGYGNKYYVNLPYDSYKSGSNYTDHVYDGGCAFVYALKNSMGDSAFNRAMKDYYSTYSYGIADTNDFVNTIRSYDPTGKTQSTIDTFIK